VLVVAPYNAQVAEIARTVQRELGARPNVGTVDKFQGREAPVAIYSMATSTPDDAPRDPDFLYSGNRLNVALSRAQGLAVLVASPALLRIACRSPEEMRLVNAFCRFVEVAAEQSLARDAPAAGGERPSERSHSVAVAAPAAVGAADARLVLFPELGGDRAGG
jgi:superfamily I DNA and/or RNA helicase